MTPASVKETTKPRTGYKW